ncbi:hypothetical protein [Mycolicibacterium brumae]|uniref:hypothetical protein n=1 Tax=Mycolicibacterium brumae TaxID=85968 RepID=UPI000AAC6947|nr:hypothetical protein [Mycolicibacterium brumae]RWA17238.1 hypothetical protein MBRU_06330 [Mycolicibacterium brumae DSM 44177]
MDDGGSIGDYRIIRRLGAGGMGEVFLAQHPRLPRRDAVKLLDGGVSRDGDYRQRFDREADLLAGLRHANMLAYGSRTPRLIQFPDSIPRRTAIGADGSIYATDAKHKRVVKLTMP